MKKRRIKVDEAPGITRNRRAAFEQTQEWAVLKKDLERGLRVGEGIESMFTPEELQEIGTSYAKTIPRFLRRYIKSQNLPYKVECRTNTATGSYTVLILHRDAGRKRRTA